MASLRKFPRSPYWYACFTQPDGRRVQRSTSEKSRRAAQTKADEYEKLSKAGAHAKQAHRVIADMYRAAHKQELPSATVRTFIADWLERRKGELAPSSHAAYEGRSNHFIEWLQEFADRPMACLETSQFVAYRNDLVKRLSPTTADQGIKLLRVILEDARRDGLVPENPAKDCRPLKKLNARDTVRRRDLTMDEIRAVLEVADAEWRGMILFGLYTGQRLKDLATLTWANVDLERAEIRLTTAKTGRYMRIPICDPLRECIMDLPTSDNVRAPIFPRMARNAEGSSLSRQFVDLLAAAGLTPKRKHSASKDGRGVKRAVSEISFHSLRHTATSVLKNLGISPSIVQDIIGHESAEMSDRYTHIEQATKLQALNAMPDLSKP